MEFITHYPTFTAKLLVQLNIVTDATNSSRIVVDINQIIRIRRQHICQRKVRNISKRNIKKRETFKDNNQKEPKDNRYLLPLHLKPFRSQVKGKHSTGKELNSLAACMSKETVVIDLPITSRNGDVHSSLIPLE